MTVPALLLLLAQSGPPVLVSEVVDPNSPALRVEIVAGMATKTARERAAADVLGSAIARGTLAYPRANLLAATSRGGKSLTVRAMSDHFRIGFSLAARDYDLAVDLIDQLIRDALLPVDSVQHLIDELPFRQRAPWTVAWFPGVGDAKLLTPTELRTIYRSVFRPGNVSIAVGGTFNAGEFRRRLGERFDTWKVTIPADPRVKYRVDPPAKPNESFRGQASLTVIRGPVVSVVAAIGERGDTFTLEEATITASMMGLGKSSALYETVRERLGQSYRQEAGLVPHPDGLQLVAAWMATKPDIALARATLLERIANWTPADMSAAREKLPRFSDLGFPLSPWLFSGEGPLTASIDDRTFLNAYWRLKTGRAWATPNLEGVELGPVRALAHRWIADGDAVTIPGR